MRDLVVKIGSLLTWVKQSCLEQLWLIGILTPLVILAAVGISRFVDDPSKDIQVRQVSHYVTSQVQISSDELSRIVSMSLAELLGMEIYFDAASSLLRGDPVMMTSLKIREDLAEKAMDTLLTYRPRRIRANVLICFVDCNNKNNQSITELV
ncbi:MAG TPA: hypothetical protein PLR90_00855 [Methylophilus sp.]|nr:hypothetical protein [Methylophilus sp.]HQQ32439.1 hypothetical protein [Methylophilus sp.]